MDHVPSQLEHDADALGGNERPALSGARRALFAALALLAAIGFAALGVWQVERRAWKLDLIERVEARIHALPATPPPVAAWPRLDMQDAEYRRVRLTGTFDHGNETLVQALTERGAGFWVLTPLRTPQGIVLVNRGFVPPERRAPQARSAGQAGGTATVTGLMRASEPKGGFLRPNDPAADRWHSRDVAAIARARNLGNVAPFFVDADASPNPGGYPVGGLTMVRFRNTHLVYALTWFALAALSGAAAVLALRMRGGR
ncbi:SURF1 family protein [Sphingomonas psychrotolerans]|uniref:SURF1-like protein n=1 Tax=Sphingomonas psychrotolerans TaxID=1327635 RepID=A0A2K8MHK5_9SPHN|nr:SURF1 family protein [Sphingomonas psychrotolerans]ATY33365.1 Surfeit locus 1 family protein [Sphingomonas psychrotolerans]